MFQVHNLATFKFIQRDQFQAAKELTRLPWTQMKL